MSDVDDDLLFDQEVEPIAAVERHALVRDGQRHLATKGNASKLQLMRQAELIGRLEQARSQMAVNLDAGTDDGVRTIREPFSLSVFLCHPRCSVRPNEELRPL